MVKFKYFCKGYTFKCYARVLGLIDDEQFACLCDKPYLAKEVSTHKKGIIKNME